MESVQVKHSVVEVRLNSYPVRRTLLVPNTVTTADLERVIEVAFDWSGDHGGWFQLGTRRISEAEAASTPFLTFIASSNLFQYIYDATYRWRHEIFARPDLDISSLERPFDRAMCIDGAGQRPPEHKFGIRAFLRALKEGSLVGFDPSKFNREEINRRLGQLTSPGKKAT